MTGSLTGALKLITNEPAGHEIDWPGTKPKAKAHVSIEAPVTVSENCIPEEAGPLRTGTIAPVCPPVPEPAGHV